MNWWPPTCPPQSDRLASALAVNPDIAYSRIICPRRLEENCAYHAFLVPTFERGRLAGLGFDPAIAPFASASAWVDYAARPEPLNMPYYHRWYFRTGGAGDFETLVRLLKWKTADPRVGRRDMDVQEPGTNMPGILDPDLHGILRLGGALRAPLITLSPDGLAEFNKYENWAKAVYPHPFQQTLARFINLADEFTGKGAEDARTDAGLPPADPDDVDPLITSPIYGEWQALQHRLLVDVGRRPASEQRQLDPRAEPRPPPSGRRGLRRRRRPQVPGRLHGGRLAPGRRCPRPQPKSPRRNDLVRYHRSGLREVARRLGALTRRACCRSRPRCRRVF